MVARVLRIVVIGVFVALFSVGWFGILALVEARLGANGLWVWAVGLVGGSLGFGVFVTALREGVAAQLVAAVVRR